MTPSPGVISAAVAEKGSLFYLHYQPVPRRITWGGKSVAVYDLAVQE